MPETRMNSLKSLAMNCGPLSEMMRGRASGYVSFAPRRMISMSASVNRLSDVPVDDVAAEAVQDAAQIVERPADVPVGDIDVPVLMRCQGLAEACALLRRFAVPLRQESRPA